MRAKYAWLIRFSYATYPAECSFANPGEMLHPKQTLHPGSSAMLTVTYSVVNTKVKIIEFRYVVSLHYSYLVVKNGWLHTQLDFL